MIKQVTTEEEYIKCEKFLLKFNAKVLHETVLFYIADSADEIMCVGGMNRNMGAFIEPIFSTNRPSALKMYYYLLGGIKMSGFKYAFLHTSNDKIREFLKDEGFVLYDNASNIYFKEL